MALFDANRFGNFQHLGHVDGSAAQFLEGIMGNLPFVIENFGADLEVLQMHLRDATFETFECFARIPAPDLGPEDIQFKLAVFRVKPLHE